MPYRFTRLRAGRVLLILLLAGVAALAAAGRADAAPWGASGADYNGVLCRLAATDVPMGAWTVNGTVTAYSTEDITGSGPQQQPAPVSGTPTTMVAGQAGFSPADIGAVAYLLAQNQGGSAAELAELSADVALVAGSGQTQARCLGQNGTSARRAASRLDAARRYAGPYTVDVTAQSGVIPGADSEVTVTVRSASGAATPGLAVSLTAGASVASLVTGSDGTARTSVAVPAAAGTAVTATVSVPSALTYIDTSPPSVTLGPLTTVTGTTTLRPVLHPTPAVTVTGADLALAGSTVSPIATVTGTFGYAGTGVVTLLGPVQPAGNDPCSSIPDASLSRAAASWQDTFTFRGDAQYRAQPTPALAAGCYALRATVTTTNSSPPVPAASALRGLTVASLTLTSTAAAKVAAPGGLAASVTGVNAGRAKVTTIVQARGPRPVGKAGCTGSFDDAPVAGSSEPTPLQSASGQLRAAIRVPDVRAIGCYSLTARSEIMLDGRTLTTTAAATMTATTAIVQPSIVVTASAVSGQQGRPMPGTVQVSGTYGFPGVVAVGVVQGTTVPITGCRDAMFAAPAALSATTKVTTKADTAYAFRTPAPPRNACYTVAATFTLDDNPAVTVSAEKPDDATVFLAGVRPDAGKNTVVQRTRPSSSIRVIVTYAVTALLILVGAFVLFVRTLVGERERRTAAPLLRWRPNRGGDGVETPGILPGPLAGP